MDRDVKDVVGVAGHAAYLPDRGRGIAHVLEDTGHEHDRGVVGDPGNGPSRDVGGLDHLAMDVEELMHKLRGLLGELGADTRDTDARPYVALALDSVVSVLNTIRAAELTIAAGASKATVDTILREHMLGRMQREAAFMGRLAEQPAAEIVDNVGEGIGGMGEGLGDAASGFGRALGYLPWATGALGIGAAIVGAGYLIGGSREGAPR